MYSDVDYGYAVFYLDAQYSVFHNSPAKSIIKAVSEMLMYLTHPDSRTVKDVMIMYLVLVRIYLHQSYRLLGRQSDSAFRKILNPNDALLDIGRQIVSGDIEEWQINQRIREAFLSAWKYNIGTDYDNLKMRQFILLNRPLSVDRVRFIGNFLMHVDSCGYGFISGGGSQAALEKFYRSVASADSDKITVDSTDKEYDLFIGQPVSGLSARLKLTTLPRMHQYKWFHLTDELVGHFINAAAEVFRDTANDIVIAADETLVEYLYSEWYNTFIIYDLYIRMGVHDEHEFVTAAYDQKNGKFTKPFFDMFRSVRLPVDYMVGVLDILAIDIFLQTAPFAISCIRNDKGFFDYTVNSRSMFALESINKNIVGRKGKPLIKSGLPAGERADESDDCCGGSGFFAIYVVCVVAYGLLRFVQ